MFPVISFLLRILLILFLLQMIRRLWQALTGSGRRAEAKRADRPASQVKSGQMQRDPVCGMYVAQDLAIAHRCQDQILYFCSEQCRKTYLESKKS
jgi:YHS domain-containing protein